VTYQPHLLVTIANRISDDIDAFSIKQYQDQHRSHLGASVIGHDCWRYSWYAFRWIKSEIFSGRMLRLFQRGHDEESKCIANLRGIGFEVWNAQVGGDQFRIVGAKGHYGGSTDSVAGSPYKDFPEKLICEFKTHNSKSLTNLHHKKLMVSKPRHYAQMCNYGKAFGIKYGLYYAVGKNDDDIYIEVVELDWTLADDLYKKAEDIIFSPHPPPKLAMQADYYECKICPFKGPCHHNTDIDRNCRSCIHAHPIEEAQWGCDEHKVIIPKEFLPQGCDRWQPIVNRG